VACVLKVEHACTRRNFLFFMNKLSLFCDKSKWLNNNMTIMKHLILSILTATALASCASGPGAQQGAVIGGLGGAAVGGIIGSQSGRGLEGAAIGGVLGAVGGNAIGNSRDRRRGYYY
jgi:hypothetical protein